ncbi:hypothetical protein [Stigmatella aurantiaca]|uniref:Conserved uncharacterized protein n=1 Tax=Stigmatella aurantiaca (strain DW4/3-1) TaxID=378806 RepID=Q094K2_STIAD|nr:hypothetical protein [Stigmatella aurantiaca]ADO68609.1 conserved uncharacterized protein [Stigmatella aurantiaca DW4/3-1]EAU67151.1 hypothetical protein STIAU_0510 [Stigmatella aurantiaca DW4/3-1]
MRRVSRLGALAGVLLFTGTAEAGGWRGYLSLGAGVALDHLSEWNVKGAAVNAYLGVEAPVGLSLGVYVEGAETWGAAVENLREDSSHHVQLDYKQIGMEVRFRVLRDRMFSPWLSLRLARSDSRPLTPDEFGQLIRQEFANLSAAVRFGLDWWLGDHLGVTAATSWQWCDVRYEQAADKRCAKPINNILLGPTLRF